MRMYIMTGTPMTGVMAFMGSTPLLPGIVVSTLHARVRAAPQSMVAGMSMEWFDVLNIIRAMWGTTIPMNPIGPQKAVTNAVSMPLRQRSRLRKRLTD